MAIQDIMSEDACIYVHLDWHIGSYVKILLDEVFGEENFINEIIWRYKTFQGQVKGYYARKHDNIYIYATSENYYFKQLFETELKDTIDFERCGDYIDANGNIYGKHMPTQDSRFNRYLRKWKKENKREPSGDDIVFKLKGQPSDSVWEIKGINPNAGQKEEYITQKPELLLDRIIKASSTSGMIVADFFSGSGTTEKVANDLNRKFIACDIGINAIQTTRDGLVKTGASFDILKIRDGLRLFRNPAQTTAIIFSIIDGFKSRTELNLNDFWDGGIAQAKGSYALVKFSGIHDKLTRELLDVYLEEIYKLEDTTNRANEVIIIYAHKDIDIDQSYLNKQLNKTAKTELKVRLVSLDSLLGEKKDTLFTPDNANIEITKRGGKYKVEIKKFFSPYLKNKIDDYNTKKTKKGTLEQDLSGAVKISNNGLELIEAVQFDTTLEKVWKSNLRLEDKAGIKDKIKGTYTLDADRFKMKIRNIAGDEIIISSEEISA